MNKWTEMRTAYRLAKLGTLSAAAEDMNVHRSTVMRHIDTLEASMGVKLFQRNDKGFIPTEAGLEIMRLGEVTDTQFNQFWSRAKSKETQLEGTLTITCVSEMSQLMLPAIVEYQTLYPKVKVNIIGDARQYNLEYGEADIALRTGDKPNTLDNIVIPFRELALVLCAHKTYVDQYGLPNEANLAEHKFIAHAERLQQLPWNEWVHLNVPPNNIVVTSASNQVLSYALQSGCGIGYGVKTAVHRTPDLYPVLPEQQWIIKTWLLVHRDLIGIEKVRKFVDILKQHRQTELSLLHI